MKVPPTLFVLLVVLTTKTTMGYTFSRRNRSHKPILFWHPMKTAGTSICSMSKSNEFTLEHIERYGFDFALNCKAGPLETKDLFQHEQTRRELLPVGKDGNLEHRFQFPVTKAGIQGLRNATGRNLVAYEPSFPTDEEWLNFNPVSVLNNEAIWREYFHIMSFRHPVDRILSHLEFDPAWRQCQPGKEVPLQKVVEAVIGGKCAKLCQAAACTVLQGQISNFYVKHLSGTPGNLERAVHHLLYHIDLPFDLTRYPRESSRMLRKSLHWQMDGTAHARKRKLTNRSYKEQNPKLYNTIAEYVSDDRVLYALAMEKFRRYFTFHGRPWTVHTKDEQRQYRLYKEWSQKV